ncbi:MAG: O-antigen ligase family protein [Candidatus Brocadiia bacterium]
MSSPRSSEGTEENPTGEQTFVAFADTATFALLVVALVLHPTQMTVRQWAEALTNGLSFGAGLASKIPAVHLTLSHVLVLLAFAGWGILKWYRHGLKSLVQNYPLPLLGLILSALISLLPFLKFARPAGTGPLAIGAGLKEFVQLCLLFVVSFLLIRDHLENPRRRKWIIVAFFTGVTIALIVGLMEYRRLRPPTPGGRSRGALISAARLDATFGFPGKRSGPHGQIGTRSNRNVFGAWLTIILPLLWAIFLYEKEVKVRIGAFLFSLIGALLLLHGGLWLAAMIGVLIVSFFRSRFAFLLTSAGMMIFFPLIFALAPQKPGQILLDSVMLRRTEDRFRTIIPLYDANPDLAKTGGIPDLTSGGRSPWQQRYIEWQPALLAFSQQSLFGHGLGNYQRVIGSYYSDKRFGAYNMSPAKAPKDLMEHGGNAFYAVWITETGFLGLLAFLWVLLAFIRMVGTQHEFNEENWGHYVAFGARGSLIAFAIGGLFTNYLVRGVGIALIFAFSLASSSSTRDSTEEH